MTGNVKAATLLLLLLHHQRRRPPLIPPLRPPMPRTRDITRAIIRRNLLLRPLTPTLTLLSPPSTTTTPSPRRSSADTDSHAAATRLRSHRQPRPPLPERLPHHLGFPMQPLERIFKRLHARVDIAFDLRQDRDLSVFIARDGVSAALEGRPGDTWGWEG